MISVFAFLSLGASVICVFSGLTVYFFNRRAVLNKVFAVALLANAYWAFCQFMVYQSSDLEIATFWSKTLSFWPFIIPLLLHFALVFTESDLPNRKAFYAILYSPALMFSVVDLTTNLISLPPVKMPWGYNPTVTVGTWICHLDGVWAAALAVYAIFIIAIYYTRVVEKNRKEQTKYVGIGIAFPIFMSLITDSVFPVLSIQFPGLGCLSGAIVSGFVVYAIWKYNLFTLNPAVAAENIVSTMPDSLVLADIKGRILSVNPSFTNLFEYQENELVGKSITTLSTDKRLTENLLPILAEKREIKNCQITCQTKSGEEKIVTISGSVVKDKRGQDVGINCIIHDVTQQKQMEQKLLKAERYASIGELAGMIGHDLRNPLTSIQGATYYLKKHLDVTDSKGESMLETIENSVEYSNKIINDLLDYSREVTLELEETAPKALILTALSLVLVPQNIKIIDQTIDDGGKIKADKTKIARVLVNLAQNAFDAMPEGGTLTITSKNIGDRVLLRFEDTGAGMSSETLGKIWKPLFTTKAKGMGFGLAICKRIVEAHGGKIWAESILGKGTTISIELPLNSVASPKTAV